jgi:hypothetical protein
MESRGFTFCTPEPSLGLDYEGFIQGLDNARVIVNLGSFLQHDFKLPKWVRVVLAMVLATRRLYSLKKS